jgi:ATP-binding cassette subfamily B protein
MAEQTPDAPAAPRRAGLAQRFGRWWRPADAPRARGGASLALTGALWGVSRPLTILFGGVAVAGGVLPVAQMAVASVLVGQLPQAVNGSSPDARTRSLTLLAVVAALYLAAQVAPAIQRSLARALGARLDGQMRATVVDAALAPPGLEHLDRGPVAEAATVVRAARTATFSTTDATAALANLVAGRLVGLLAVVILLWFHWWAPVVLLVTFLPWDRYFRAEHRKIERSWTERTPHQRRAIYFRDLATDAGAGKELRLFGLADFVLGRYVAHFIAGMSPLWQQRGTDIRRFLPRVLSVIAGYLVVYGMLGRDLAAQQLSLTGAVLFVQMSGQVWRLVPSFNDLSRLTIGAGPLLVARQIEAVSSTPTATARAPVAEIRFEGVCFAYPSSERPVLRDLSLTIPMGQSLAIVGDNGAGKTTIAKLLCGLHQPAAGLITVDGVDLREWDPHSWRRYVAAVFQDYVRYPLTLHDNVGWGAAGQADRPMVLRALAGAAALDLVDRLPEGLETVLSREFPGGAELSGGQWQKVAVARALAGLDAGARVLILDEPTANLDVRAEAALFDHILAAAEGVTTLLVSHRFANVRRASRIVVLDGGQVVEDGSHDQLMARDGYYATMFQLEAARFHAPVEPAVAKPAVAEEESIRG